MNAAARNGMTLMEVVVASAIGVTVIGAVALVNQQEARLAAQVRLRTTVVGNDLEPAIALIDVVRTLERADRVRLPSAGVVQARVFEPAGACATTPYGPGCLDVAANYRWTEYAHVDLNGDGTRDALRLYTNTGAGCTSTAVLSRNVQILNFTYLEHEANAAQRLPPPGGDPAAATFSGAPNDNNLLQYQLRWNGVVSGRGKIVVAGVREYRGAAVLRNAPYGDVNAGASSVTDSGLGLTGAAIAPPPLPCCRPPTPCT